MTSVGNNFNYFNYFAENQLTKFSARDAGDSRTFQDQSNFPGLSRSWNIKEKIQEAWES